MDDDVAIYSDHDYVDGYDDRDDYNDNDNKNHLWNCDENSGKKEI